MRWYLFVVLAAVPCIICADNALLCDGGYSGPTDSSVCYRVYESPPLSYDDARKSCQGQGGDLASIHNIFENAFIKTFNKDGVFIGLRFSESENAFKWSDGTPLDYRNYVEGFEGNIDFYGDCAQFRSTSGKWDNADCGNLLKYICERPAISYPVTPNNACPNSSTLCVDGGVLLSPGYPSTYVAGLNCEYKLAAKNEYVIKIFLDEIDIVYQKDYLVIYNDLDVERWNLQLFPLEAAGYEITIRTNRIRIQLASTNAGKWKLTWTELKASLVMPAIPQHGKITSGANEYFLCPSGYTLSGLKCYRLVSNAQLNYFDAVVYCRDEGADLVSIHDSYSDTFLQKLISSVGQALIGLLYVGNDVYQWSDGTPLDYTNYAAGFVEYGEYLGYCARLKNGKWQNAECNEKFSFICEKKATNFTQTPNNACPDSTTVYKNGGVILSPGYPQQYIGTLPNCEYELLAKRDHFIKIVMEEAGYPLNDYIFVYYNTNGNWLFAGMRTFFFDSDGDEVVFPHNHIVLQLSHNTGQPGSYRINWTEIGRP